MPGTDAPIDVDMEITTASGVERRRVRITNQAHLPEPPPPLERLSPRASHPTRSQLRQIERIMAEPDSVLAQYVDNVLGERDELVEAAVSDAVTEADTPRAWWARIPWLWIFAGAWFGLAVRLLWCGV